MRMTGTHRVAVDAFGRNLSATSSLNGVIESNDDFTRRNEGRNQQLQEKPRGGYGRPMGAIEKTMIVLKMRVIGFTTNAQASGDGALANSENRPNEQDFGVFKDRLGEQRREDYNQVHQFGRQGQHTSSFLGRKSCSLLILPLLFQRSKWIKSSSDITFIFVAL